MARQPKANINKLIKALRKAYAKEDKADDGTIYSHSMTEDDVQRVAAMAKPLYDLANGLEPILRPMTDEDATELIAVLQSFKVKVDCIERVPLNCPELPGCADWLISELDWRGVALGYEYERRAIERLFDDLSAACVETLPDDIENALSYQHRKQFNLYREWSNELWLVASLADYLVTPDHHDGRAERKKARQIEKIFPYLVKWRILGFRKDEKTTLCVLVP